MDINIQQLISHFHPKKRDEIIPWAPDNKYIGFSILRSYQKNLGFIPAVTKSGEEDTKVLIKIGISIPEDNLEVPVLLSVSKYSKYKGSHFGIDFDYKNAPTRESFNKSEKSKQPIDLESRNEYVMRSDSFLFFEKRTNKQISLDKIIDLLYDQHLRTINSVKGRILKVKLKSRYISCNRIIPKLINILKCSLKIFGKEIKDAEDDFAVGLFKPYSFSKHITTKYPYSLPFFSSEVRVSLFNIFWVSALLILLWFLYFVNKGIENIFAISLSVISIAIFEIFIPMILMGLINALIICRNWLERRRFKFK